MVAIGMLVIWGGYSLGLFGWTLFRDYDVTLGQLVNPVHPYGSGKGEPWPPPLIPDTQIWPGAAPAGGGGGGCPPGQILATDPATGATKCVPQGKGCPPGQVRVLDPRTGKMVCADLATGIKGM